MDIRWILECAKEFQKVSLCFIDYSKAFDCVDQEKLWVALKETMCASVFDYPNF